MEEAKQSAFRLLGLTPAVIACGHGPPMKNHDAEELIKFYHEIKN
jgi:hypothetical protein